MTDTPSIENKSQVMATPIDIQATPEPLVDIMAAPASVPPTMVSSERIVRATCANARTALVNLGLKFSYDTFRDKFIIKDSNGFEAELSDHALLQLKMIINSRYGFEP